MLPALRFLLFSRAAFPCNTLEDYDNQIRVDVQRASRRASTSESDTYDSGRSRGTIQLDHVIPISVGALMFIAMATMIAKYSCKTVAAETEGNRKYSSKKASLTVIPSETKRGEAQLPRDTDSRDVATANAPHTKSEQTQENDADRTEVKVVKEPGNNLDMFATDDSAEVGVESARPDNENPGLELSEIIPNENGEAVESGKRKSKMKKTGGKELSPGSAEDDNDNVEKKRKSVKKTKVKKDQQSKQPTQEAVGEGSGASDSEKVPQPRKSKRKRKSLTSGEE